MGASKNRSFSRLYADVHYSYYRLTIISSCYYLNRPVSIERTILIDAETFIRYIS